MGNGWDGKDGARDAMLPHVGQLCVTASHHWHGFGAVSSNMPQREAPPADQSLALSLCWERSAVCLKVPEGILVLSALTNRAVGGTSSVKLPSVRGEENTARVKKKLLLLFVPCFFPTCRAGHPVLRAEEISCRRC